MTAATAPRVLLLDVDGTLVNYRTELPADAAAAVREARARGHRVYLCTGRGRAEIYDHLWELGVDGLIGGNGSYVEDAGRAIFHQVLDPSVVAEAVEWLLAEELGFYLECNSGLYGSDDLPEKAAMILGGPTPENVRFITDAMPHLIYGTRSGRDDVNKISFVLEPGVDLEALAARYAGRNRHLEPHRQRPGVRRVRPARRSQGGGDRAARRPSGCGRRRPDRLR